MFKKNNKPKTLEQKREDLFPLTLIILLVSWDSGPWKEASLRKRNRTGPNATLPTVRMKIFHPHFSPSYGYLLSLSILWQDKVTKTRRSAKSRY